MFLKLFKMVYTINIGVNMKVVYVVDTITDLTSKIEMLKSRFGKDILYVVKGELLSIFKTYGYQANAVYSKNLPKTIEALLLPSVVDDVVICHASVNLTNKLLNDFLLRVGDKTKIVNVIPKYNIFERISNSTYNVYVKSLFKTHDSLASPKLQFLPSAFVIELVSSHFANKLFQVNPAMSKNLDVEDKAISNSLKIKTKFNKMQLLPIIAFFIISLALVLTLAFAGIHYIIIVAFICLYALDIVLAIIQQCKIYFDQRFLK